MKVLLTFLGIFSRIGGIERFGERVLRSLSELSSVKESKVLVLWDRPKDQALAPAGVDYIPFDSSKLAMAARFSSLTLRWRPDIILLGHCLFAPLAPIAASLCPRARIFLFVYGNEVWDPPPFPRGWIARRFLDRIVSISQFTAQRMQTAFHLDSGKFELLPCAVDLPDDPQEWKAYDGRLEGKFRILTVARLNPPAHYKGHAEVMRALVDVLRSFPDTHYYIVGDGPLRPGLEQLAASLGIKSHVHFLGYVEESALLALYQNCHVFALPSREEGFGIVFLEAWKYCLPVIAGNEDASREVVQDNVTGVLVTPSDPEEIGHAISGLLASAEKRVRLGKAGNDRLRQQYTHLHFRRRLGEILAS